MGKFLRIFFGCHARADRSFFFRGKQFPICARCTGELLGMICAIIMSMFHYRITILWCIVMVLPLLFDGVIQLITRYESNNIKRIITGFLFGIAFIFMLIHFHTFMMDIIYKMLTKIVGVAPPYFHIHI